MIQQKKTQKQFYNRRARDRHHDTIINEKWLYVLYNRVQNKTENLRTSQKLIEALEVYRSNKVKLTDGRKGTYKKF